MNRMPDTLSELKELLAELADGALTPLQMARLDALLANNPEAQQYYVEYIDLCATLRHYEGAVVVGKGSEGNATKPQAGVLNQSPTKLKPGRGRYAGWMAVAAALLLAVGAGGTYLVKGWERSEAPLEIAAEAIEDQHVAVLTRSVDAAWDDTELPTTIGSTLPPGRLRLKSGLAQLEFYGGATVVLQGPADFELLDIDRGFCREGKLRASVLRPARGFTLHTPTVDLVEHGTEFGIQVERDKGAKIHVFKGTVEVHGPQGGAGESAREVSSGQCVRVSADGDMQPMKPEPAAYIGEAELELRSNQEIERRYHAWRLLAERMRTDPRLVLYYTFEQQQPWERSLRNRVLHAQGTLDAALVGASWSEGRWPGKGALEFKRPSDRVRLHVPGEFPALTLMTWVRIDAFERWLSGLFLTDGHDPGEPHWQLSNKGQIIFGLGGCKPDYSPVVLGPEMLGRWLHLAVVCDRQTLTYYLNGQVIDTKPYPANGPIKIGDAEIGNWGVPRRGNPEPVRGLKGRMDEFLLFQQALTPDEIYRIYLEGQPAPG